MDNNTSGTLVLEYNGIGADMSRDEIVKAALGDWRSFVGNELANLPWSTSIAVHSRSGSCDATVTIRWERESR